MNKLKLTAVISSFALTLSFFSGCQKVQRVGNITDGLIEGITETTETVTSAITTDTTTVETYPEYPVTYPEIKPADMGQKYQAEEYITNTDFQSETAISGFEGTGYITGFNGNNLLDFQVSVPTNQHYDLTFCISAESEILCSIQINERKIGQFKTNAEGKFTKITMHGVFLTEGASSVAISSDGNDMAVDYLEISNNTSLKDIGYNNNSTLSNANAGESAQELMQFLSDNYGKYVITGQYASDNTNSEIDLIYSITGKKPAIRFSALQTSYASYDESFRDIDACADWFRNGGIVGLMWYWRSPDEKASVYAEETDFRISDAITDIDISCMTQEEIRGLYGEGKISKECYGIILDIDNMAGQLMSLKDKGIPVLWRPLHEASGEWFWWGASGADDYRWLWKLMYTRMTEYFELDNLIWIWNGQSKEYIVPSDTFDIASMDIYISPDKEYGSQYEYFASLQDFIGQDKLIALSECSSIPDIDSVFRDNSVWSFFGLWYGEYLTDNNGNISEKYMPREYIIKNYNSAGTMTLDKYQELTGYEPPEITEPHTENTSETQKST